MSADNWTVCPQCYDKAMIPWREEAEKAQKLSGILTLEEFIEVLDQLPEKPSVQGCFTFKEEYCFYGAKDGVVIWKYSGSCTKCKISVSGSGELPFYPYPDGNKKEC